MFLGVVNPTGYFSNLMSSYFFVSVAGNAGGGGGGGGGGGVIRYFSARVKGVTTAWDRSSYCLGSSYSCAFY